MEAELIKNRLVEVAKKVYPIPDNMCAFRKQGQEYKRIALVWRLEKELKLLTDSQIELILSELEAKAAA